MVQETINQPVPDELYNLTQLAEVACFHATSPRKDGSTRTTPDSSALQLIGNTNAYQQYRHHIDNNEDNSSIIKYYSLGHDSHQPYNDYYIPSYVSTSSLSSCSDNESENILADYKFSSTKKKWKTNWENNAFKNSQKSVADDDSDSSNGSMHNGTNTTTSTTKTYANLGDNNIRSYIKINYNSAVSQKATYVEDESKRRGSFTTSSEDSDSTFSYSHKVFDRKKSRTLSWNHKINLSDNLETEENVSKRSSSTSDDLEFDSSGHVDSLNSSGEQTLCCGENGNLDVHICPECGKKYSTSSNLARHRQTHRSLQDKKARRCPHCDKVYVSMPAFSMHVRTHSLGCQCPHCGKAFSRPWLLQGHIRTHTGEKPFSCNVCQKSFADKSNLRAHIQTHSNTKPHSCSRCGKAFALKSYLYKHEESSCLKNHLKSEKMKNLPTSKSNSSNRKKAIKESVLNLNAEINQAIKDELLMKKNAVKAKIREVLEDNSKKSKLLLCGLNTYNPHQKSFSTQNAQNQQTPTPPPADNRISVIRTTSQTYENFYSPYTTPNSSSTNYPVIA